MLVRLGVRPIDAQYATQELSMVLARQLNGAAEREHHPARLSLDTRGRLRQHRASRHRHSGRTGPDRVVGDAVVRLFGAGEDFLHPETDTGTPFNFTFTGFRVNVSP